MGRSKTVIPGEEGARRAPQTTQPLEGGGIPPEKLGGPIDLSESSPSTRYYGSMGGRPAGRSIGGNKLDKLGNIVGNLIGIGIGLAMAGTLIWQGVAEFGPYAPTPLVRLERAYWAAHPKPPGQVEQGRPTHPGSKVMPSEQQQAPNIVPAPPRNPTTEQMAEYLNTTAFESQGHSLLQLDVQGGKVVGGKMKNRNDTSDYMGRITGGTVTGGAIVFEWEYRGGRGSSTLAVQPDGTLKNPKSLDNPNAYVFTQVSRQ